MAKHNSSCVFVWFALLLTGSGAPFFIGINPITVRIGTALDFDRSRGIVGIADMNLDGKPDLVMPSMWFDTFILTNDGKGFTTTNPYVKIPNGSAVLVMDVNGDAKPDLIVDRSGPSVWDLAIKTNDGNGNFTVACSLPHPFSNLGDITAVDLDNDGWSELIERIVAVDVTVDVLTNDHRGTFSRAGSIQMRSSSSPYAIVPGDYNGDGLVDLILATYGANPELHTNNGLGKVIFANELPQKMPPYDQQTLLCADMNHDGSLDIVAGTWLMTNDGAGGFSIACADLLGDPGEEPDLVAVHDFDGDGWPEIVTTDEDAEIMILQSNRQNEFSTVLSLPTGIVRSFHVANVGVQRTQVIVATEDCLGCGAYAVSLFPIYDKVPLTLTPKATNEMELRWPFTEPRLSVFANSDCATSEELWTYCPESWSPEQNALARWPMTNTTTFFILRDHGW